MQPIEWRPVVGYEGLYEVSDGGDVRRVAAGRGTHAGRILKPSPDPLGRPRVNLSRAGIVRTAFIHRLVALAFIGEPRPGEEVCHGDGDNQNNSVGNLRWDTHYANHLDSVSHGTYAVQPKATHCKRGHEFTPENTYLQPGRASQHCRACRAEHARTYKARRSQ